MCTGFIYVVRSVTRDYAQPFFCSVPTEWGNRLYFGPCKRPMRPRMRPGDYVFGISPSKTSPRRIVFVTQIEERISFREAYHRFPELRGPEGPVHVKPVDKDKPFPRSDYEHIPNAMHADDWEADLATRDRDAFFVCTTSAEWKGRWLGPYGPEVDDEILAFLQTCCVYGNAGFLSATNTDATIQHPIAHGGLYTGLHLETDEPEVLVEMCDARMTSTTLHDDLEKIAVPERRAKSKCGSTAPRTPPRRPRCC